MIPSLHTPSSSAPSQTRGSNNQDPCFVRCIDTSTCPNRIFTSTIDDIKTLRDDEHPPCFSNLTPFFQQMRQRVVGTIAWLLASTCPQQLQESLAGTALSRRTAELSLPYTVQEDRPEEIQITEKTYQTGTMTVQCREYRYAPAEEITTQQTLSEILINTDELDTLQIALLDDGKPSDRLSESTSASGNEQELLDLHGGGYVMYPAKNLDYIGIHLAQQHPTKTILALDYTLAPSAKFPHQLFEALALWTNRLIEGRKTPDELFIVGDSAGGHLAISLYNLLAVIQGIAGETPDQTLALEGLPQRPNDLLQLAERIGVTINADQQAQAAKTLGEYLQFLLQHDRDGHFQSIANQLIDHIHGRNTHAQNTHARNNAMHANCQVDLSHNKQAGMDSLPRSIVPKPKQMQLVSPWISPNRDTRNDYSLSKRREDLIIDESMLRFARTAAFQSTPPQPESDSLNNLPAEHPRRNVSPAIDLSTMPVLCDPTIRAKNNGVASPPAFQFIAGSREVMFAQIIAYFEKLSRATSGSHTQDTALAEDTAFAEDTKTAKPTLDVLLNIGHDPLMFNTGSGAGPGMRTYWSEQSNFD